MKNLLLAVILLLVLGFAGCRGEEVDDDTYPANGGQGAVGVEGTGAQAAGDEPATQRVPTPERMTFIFNGERTSLGVAPMRVDDVPMIPINIFQLMGAFVYWDDETERVNVATVDNRTISFVLDGTGYTVGGASRNMERAPALVFGRVMLPVSFIENNMPISFNWDDEGNVLFGETTYFFDAVLGSPGGLVPVMPDVVLPEAALNILGRSWVPLTDRRLTPSEVQAWIDRYLNAGGASSNEMALFHMTNAIRMEHGLDPLLMDENLMRAARFKSQEMFDLRYFSHTSPVYGAATEIPRLFGAMVSSFGENIFQASHENVYIMLERWMGSENHRANILNPNWTVMGIGIFNGRATQMFSGDMSDQPPPPTQWVWFPLHVRIGEPVISGLRVDFPVTVLGTGGPGNVSEIGVQLFGFEIYGNMPTVDDIRLGEVTVLVAWQILREVPIASLQVGGSFRVGDTVTLTHTFERPGQYFAEPFAFNDEGRFFADQTLGDIIDDYHRVEVNLRGEARIWVVSDPSGDWIRGGDDGQRVTFEVESEFVDDGFYSISWGHVCFGMVTGFIEIQGNRGTLTITHSTLWYGRNEMNLGVWNQNDEFITTVHVVLNVVDIGRFPTIIVLEQLGRIAAGTRGIVNFSVVTEHVPEGFYHFSGGWFTWLTIMGNISISSVTLNVNADGTAVLSKDVDATGMVLGGEVRNGHHIWIGANHVQNITWTLVVDDEAPLPRVAIGRQLDNVVHGTGGAVRFPVLTHNVYDGFYGVWYFDARIHHGSMETPISITAGSGELLLHVPASVWPGQYVLDVSFFINGRIVVAPLVLMVGGIRDEIGDPIRPPERILLGPQTDADWIEVGRVVAATFDVETPGVADGTHAVQMDTDTPGVEIISEITVSGGVGSMVLEITIGAADPGTTHDFSFTILTPAGDRQSVMHTMEVADNGQVGFTAR